MPTTVALIEDQPDIREGLAELLREAEGFALAGEYGSGEAALDAFADSMPDVVVLDLGLPGMSGVEALVRMKAISPTVKVVVFTVFDNDDKVFEALKAGASGYVLKKEPPAHIVEHIREVLDGGAPMSREIARKVLASFREKTPGAQLPMSLSERDRMLLELLSKGYLYKEIADQMHTSLGMVKQHLHKIYEKLHVQNRTEAVNRYWGR